MQKSILSKYERLHVSIDSGPSWLVESSAREVALQELENRTLLFEMLKMRDEGFELENLIPFEEFWAGETEPTATAQAMQPHSP